ncbi:hypothetical protein [Microcystis aeruginosa]|uniref:hypothetical protein n=1 Tax=Microcystis aeruginosa TaxID=1126 RepID=UPI0005A175D2|nr:hypothetical protein [Microcystis aeruginosa]
MNWGDGEMGRPLRARCGGRWGDHFVRVAGGDGEMGSINENNLLTPDSRLLTPDTTNKLFQQNLTTGE